MVWRKSKSKKKKKKELEYLELEAAKRETAAKERQVVEDRAAWSIFVRTKEGEKVFGATGVGTIVKTRLLDDVLFIRYVAKDAKSIRDGVKEVGLPLHDVIEWIETGWPEPPRVYQWPGW